MTFVDVIYSIPETALALIIIGIAVIYSVGGLILVQKYFPPKLKDQNDLTAGVVPIIGTVFAVLVAFFIVIIWQKYDDSVKITQKEAGVLSDLWRQSLGYPEPFRTKLRTEIEQYLETIINVEWPLMQKGKESTLAWSQIENIERQIILYQPTTSEENQIQAIQISDIQKAIDYRRDRLFAINDGINAVIWVVIIVSSLLTIGSTWFFGSTYFLIHVIGVILLGLSVGLLVFLAIVVSYPFRGTSDISPKYYQDAFDNIIRYTQDEKYFSHNS